MSQPVPNIVVIVPTPPVTVQFAVDVGVLTLQVLVQVVVL